MTELETIVSTGNNFSPATKTCSRCDIEKPTTEFRPRSDGRGGGLFSWCKPCHDAYLRDRNQEKYEQGRAREPSRVPDPKPVQVLRMELERLRTQDMSFSLAWSCALQVALRSMWPPTRRDWEEALRSTRSAWQSAYTRMEPAPEHAALAMLRPDVESWTVFLPDTDTQVGSEPPQADF